MLLAIKNTPATARPVLKFCVRGQTERGAVKRVTCEIFSLYKHVFTSDNDSDTGVLLRSYWRQVVIGHSFSVVIKDPVL